MPMSDGSEGPWSRVPGPRNVAPRARPPRDGVSLLSLEKSGHRLGEPSRESRCGKQEDPGACINQVQGRSSALSGPRLQKTVSSS